MQNLQSLFYPVVQFLHCGRLVDVVNFALSLLQGLLNNLFLLKIVDLLLDLPALIAEKWLAKHEEER